MNKRKIIAIYSIVVGVSMFAFWSAYLATCNVMGLKPMAAEVWYHIAAELLTGVVLIAAGIGLWTGRGWGRNAFLVGMGMLIYAIVNSMSYYAGPGVLTMKVMFAASGVMAVVFTWLGWGLGGESS